jgi:predicted PhzF superfamily epimerase YddE/YHI9
LRAGLKVEPDSCFRVDADPNYYAVFGDEGIVRDLGPDLNLLATLHPYGVVATAPGREVDFVSRYFVPSFGIPEDPATGSIHAVLTPYWAARLGRVRLDARQISRRGGELRCALEPDRVRVAGRTSLYLEGAILIPHPAAG